MSDFDDALERLITDPEFAAALEADPAGALAGYRLSAEEVALLHTSVSTGAGGQRAVEQRITKAGMFGLFGGFTDALADAADAADAGGRLMAGDAPGGRFVPADGDGQGGRFVPADGGGQGGHFVGTETMGGQFVESPPELPEGYQPRLDVDGDGRWDGYTASARADGGVELRVDTDGDGQVDFVAHDRDADAVVDSADLDTDGDGTWDTAMTDDDGDGWLDRTVRRS